MGGNVRNFESHYFRPSPEKIDGKALEWMRERIANKRYERQLSSNTYLLEIRQRRFLGRGYRSVVFVDDKSPHTYEVPTNKNGVIPAEIMALRIMDTASGDRNGRERNMWVDFAIDAEVMAKPEEQLKSYEWFLHPNESDVKGIDDHNTKILTLIGQGKTGRRNVIITGGTEKQRENVAKALKTNFTLRERQVISGVMIKIAPAGSGVAGYFMKNTDMSGRETGVPIILY